MSGHRRRRNPDWSWSLLDAIWDKLKRRLGPNHQDLMPVAVDDPLPALTNPVVHEFGTGKWGVAMPTRNPRWACKITRDWSEAQLVNCLRKLRRNCTLRGIVRTSPVYECEQDAGGDPVFVYWRERAALTGDDAWDEFANGTRRTMALQAYNRVIDALYVIRSTDTSTSEYKAAVANLLKNPFLAETGEDLLELASEGVLVTDLNLNNWGVIPRRSNRMTLIDPGLVRYLTPAAKRLRAGIPWL
jgi:hypothetical protein